jgi:hypothetical protein
VESCAAITDPEINAMTDHIWARIVPALLETLGREAWREDTSSVGPTRFHSEKRVQGRADIIILVVGTKIRPEVI